MCHFDKEIFGARPARTRFGWFCDGHVADGALQIWLTEKQAVLCALCLVVVQESLASRQAGQVKFHGFECRPHIASSILDPFPPAFFPCVPRVDGRSKTEQTLQLGFTSKTDFKPDVFSTSWYLLNLKHSYDDFEPKARLHKFSSVLSRVHSETAVAPLNPWNKWQS